MLFNVEEKFIEWGRFICAKHVACVNSAVGIIFTLQWFSQCLWFAAQENIHAHEYFHATQWSEDTPKIVLLHGNMSFSQFFKISVGKFFCPTSLTPCQVKPCPWPDIWQAHRKKLFPGLGHSALSKIFFAKVPLQLKSVPTCQAH